MDPSMLTATSIVSLRRRSTLGSSYSLDDSIGMGSCNTRRTGRTARLSLVSVLSSAVILSDTSSALRASPVREET